MKMNKESIDYAFGDVLSSEQREALTKRVEQAQKHFTEKIASRDVKVVDGEREWEAVNLDPKNSYLLNAKGAIEQAQEVYQKEQERQAQAAAAASRGPQAPQAAQASQASRAPQAPQASQAPRTPQAAQAPQAPRAPQVPQAPRGPQAAQASQAPRAPRAPQAPQTPRGFAKAQKPTGQPSRIKLTIGNKPGGGLAALQNEAAQAKVIPPITLDGVPIPKLPEGVKPMPLPTQPQKEAKAATQTKAPRPLPIPPQTKGPATAQAKTPTPPQKKDGGMTF